MPFVGFLFAVGAGEFHVDSEVAVEVGLGSVEVEITDGDAAAGLKISPTTPIKGISGS
jgi:hypothetical protein